MLYSHSVPIACYLYFPLIFLSQPLQQHEWWKAARRWIYWHIDVYHSMLNIHGGSQQHSSKTRMNRLHTHCLAAGVWPDLQAARTVKKRKEMSAWHMTAQPGNWLLLNHHEGWFPERFKAQERRCQKKKDGMSRKQSLVFTNLQHSHD